MALFSEKGTKLSLNCDHPHIKMCANRKLHRRKMESEYCSDIFLFNFVFSAANLLLNFISSHPVLEYEIKSVANFVNFSLPR